METGRAKCTVHFLPARAGDCLVLELDNKNCILIDCGYPSTYREELKPLLQKLAKDGCRISLMILTHIDEDHISGAISFIEENGDAENPQIIQVDEIWHNGIFNTVLQSELFLKHKREKVPKGQPEKYRRTRGLLKKQLHGEEGMISALQSKLFESVCAKHHYRINSTFEDRCVLQNCRYFMEDCEVKVLSPGIGEIENLRKMLDREMIRAFGADYTYNRTEEFAELLELIARYRGKDEAGTFTIKQIAAGAGDIEAWLGTSGLAKMNEINCASIVVAIQYKEIKLLFMGDSESGLWAEQLEPHYDLIKVSHHGTTKPNLAWMEHTNATKMLISTDGSRHGHPEDEFLARAMKGEFTELYFNYNIPRKSVILTMQGKYHFKAEFGKKEITLN